MTLKKMIQDVLGERHVESRLGIRRVFAERRRRELTQLLVALVAISLIFFIDWAPLFNIPFGFMGIGGTESRDNAMRFGMLWGSGLAFLYTYRAIQLRYGIGVFPVRDTVPKAYADALRASRLNPSRRADDN